MCRRGRVSALLVFLLTVCGGLVESAVDDYLGKPYQESQLLDAIEPLVHRRAASAVTR